MTMKTISSLIIAFCSLLTLYALSFGHAEDKKATMHDRTQLRLKKFEFEAANIYEAVNHTLSLAVEEDPSLRDITIVIGPMKPRSNEKPHKMTLENETVSEILRYWSELYQFNLIYKDKTLIFNEDFSEKLIQQ
jgi:hypothetical protein